MYKAKSRAEAKRKKEKAKRKQAPYIISRRTTHIDRPGKCFNCKTTSPREENG